MPEPGIMGHAKNNKEESNRCEFACPLSCGGCDWRTAQPGEEARIYFKTSIKEVKTPG